MEQNMPIVAKRLWSIVRVVYFMLRKSISKRKLMLDLNIMAKRGKLAGKALSGLSALFHHHKSPGKRGGAHLDYEFSCADSPAAFPGLFTRRGLKSPSPWAGGPLGPDLWTGGAPPAPDEVCDLSMINVMLEMINNNRSNNNNNRGQVGESPALPGFGKTPRARKLRITDSPFPIKEADEDSEVVDRAAEEFIRKFYRQLEHQKV